MSEKRKFIYLFLFAISYGISMLRLNNRISSPSYTKKNYLKDRNEISPLFENDTNTKILNLFNYNFYSG